MASPVVDIYRDLVVPLGERLRNSESFADIKNIVYDTDEIAFSEMPAIEYYVESPWTDMARGSGSYSIQTRKLVVKMVFTIWIYDSQSRQRMDEAMFHVGGLLLDFLRDNTDFDPVKGVGLTPTPLVWQVARPETTTGFVGIHSITAEFEIYSGTGK